MDKKAGGKIMINVLCTKEETFKNAVYTADKGVFSGVGTSKKFCSNEIGADAVIYILPEGIRENIGSQNLIMVNLSVKSNRGTGKIKINLTGDENCVLSSMEYAVPAQWTQIKTPLIIEDEKLAKISICDTTTFDKISTPSRTTAAAVSSQLVSIPRINIPVLYHKIRQNKSINRENISQYE